jgi:hypothetical protein
MVVADQLDFRMRAPWAQPGKAPMGPPTRLSTATRSRMRCKWRPAHLCRCLRIPVPRIWTVRWSVIRFSGTAKSAPETAGLWWPARRTRPNGALSWPTTRASALHAIPSSRRAAACLVCRAPVHSTTQPWAGVANLSAFPAFVNSKTPAPTTTYAINQRISFRHAIATGVVKRVEPLPHTRPTTASRPQKLRHYADAKGGAREIGVDGFLDEKCALRRRWPSRLGP